jgi:hypothetical protein
MGVCENVFLGAVTKDRKLFKEDAHILTEDAHMLTG